MHLHVAIITQHFYEISEENSVSRTRKDLIVEINSLGSESFLSCNTAPIKRMYPYGPASGDSEVPNTFEYSRRCFKVDIPDDGMQFFGKRHYRASVCIQICS